MVQNSDQLSGQCIPGYDFFYYLPKKMFLPVRLSPLLCGIFLCPCQPSGDLQVMSWVFQVPYAFQWYQRGSVIAAIMSSPGIFTSAPIICRPSLIAKYTASGFTASGYILIVLFRRSIPVCLRLLASVGILYGIPHRIRLPPFLLLLFWLHLGIAGKGLQDRYPLTFLKKF